MKKQTKHNKMLTIKLNKGKFTTNMDMLSKMVQYFCYIFIIGPIRDFISRRHHSEKQSNAIGRQNTSLGSNFSI